MSTRPFADIDFANVADFLLESSGDIPTEPEVWEDSENARARCAISRSYYAVFLALKTRIQPARTGWKFPERDAHKLLRKALESVLGSHDPLVLHMRALLRERKKADYEAALPFDLADADSLIVRCWDAIDCVEALDATRLRAIADELYDLARQ